MSALRARFALAVVLLATPVAAFAGPGAPTGTAPQPTVGHAPHVGGGSAPQGRR